MYFKAYFAYRELPTTLFRRFPMRSITLSIVLLSALATQVSATPTTNSLSGDYVEARTASVFAGACHYNGELVTAGKEAEMAWSIKEGTWNGVSLKGIVVLAAVSSTANLKDTKAKRESVLYIDNKTTPEQEKALLAAMNTRYSKTLGKVISIKRTLLSFKREKDTFQVEAKGITTMSVKPMPNSECCKMPNQVWYEPLVRIQNRKVGFTEASGVQEKSLRMNWQKELDNTAFYGTFTLE
jgi:hypothetical protein